MIIAETTIICGSCNPEKVFVLHCPKGMVNDSPIMFGVCGLPKGYHFPSVSVKFKYVADEKAFYRKMIKG